MTQHDKLIDWILHETGNADVNYSASTLELFGQIYMLGFDDAQQQEREKEEKKAKRDMVRELNSLLS